MLKKQTQQEIQHKQVIKWNIHKHLINTQSKAPKLNAYLETQNENTPIRPVTNKLEAP